jgi:hypothetical protein
MTKMPPIYSVFTISTSDWADKLLTQGIQFFAGKGPSHACLIYWSTDFSCWIAIGANWNGITEDRLDTFLKTHIITDIYSPVGFSFWEGMKEHSNNLDEHYAFSALPGMALVSILERFHVHPRRNELESSHELFCSQWVSEVIRDSLLPVMYTKWPLYTINSSIISPQQLRNNEQVSPYFARIDPKLLLQPWKDIASS